jgi:hypothetical protein
VVNRGSDDVATFDASSGTLQSGTNAAELAGETLSRARVVEHRGARLYLGYDTSDNLTELDVSRAPRRTGSTRRYHPARRARGRWPCGNDRSPLAPPRIVGSNPTRLTP